MTNTKVLAESVRERALADRERSDADLAFVWQLDMPSGMVRFHSLLSLRGELVA